MYQKYLKMTSTPAGKILFHILKKQGRTQAEIARRSGLIPQRLNDLIMGKRRFTPTRSIALEEALGITIRGFFYICQANHDVYEFCHKEELKTKPDMSIISKSTFWDSDISRINWIRDKYYVIHRVLEYGSIEELKELDRFYGHNEILAIYNDPKNFRLYNNVQQKFKEAFL